MRMKFNTDYERRNPRDNDLQVRVEAGTEVEVETVIRFSDESALFTIKTEAPCTKGGNSEFNMSKKELSRYLSEVENT